MTKPLAKLKFSRDALGVYVKAIRRVCPGFSKISPLAKLASVVTFCALIVIPAIASTSLVPDAVLVISMYWVLSAKLGRTKRLSVAPVRYWESFVPKVTAVLSTTIVPSLTLVILTLNVF